MLAMVCFSLTPMVKRTGTTSTSSPRRSGSSGSPSRQLGGSKNCTIMKSLREEGERKRGGREGGREDKREREREGGRGGEWVRQERDGEREGEE